MNSISFIWGLVSLLVHCLSVIAVLRLRLKVHTIIQHAASAILIHVISLVIVSRLFHGLPYWHGAAIYWLGVWAYLYLFSAVYTSVTFDILQYTAAQQDYKIQVMDLVDSCIKPSFDARIDMMVTGSLISQTDDRFNITMKGKDLVRRIKFLHKLLGIETSGLYKNSN